MCSKIFLILWCSIGAVHGHYQNVDVNSCRVGLKLSCGEGEDSIAADDHSGIQGRPGKRGIPGVQGPVGAPGLKGSKGEPCRCEDQLSGFQNRLLALETRYERYQASKCPQTKFKFPLESQTTDWIRAKVPIPSITALTVCAWITPLTSSGVKGGFVSYATWSEDNEFILYFNTRSSLEICIKDQWISRPISINVKSHFCVSASPVEGWSKIYKNGILLSSIEFSSRQAIDGDGAFLIGQEQDTFMGSLDASQAFGGTVENFMTWYRILEESEIQALHGDRCNCPENFSITLSPDQIQLEGKVMSLGVEQC